MSPRTVESYLACVRQLSEFYDRSPELIRAEEIRQYFIHLKTHKKVARQTSTQALCAIKIFWEKTLRRPWPQEVELVRANPQFKLPVILSASEVRRILAAVTALDHRVCLILIYSCGLRLGEGLRLEVRDIDAQRMLLHIRAGKGHHDRYVLLPQRTLLLLRELWKTHSHPTLLFPGKGHGGQGAKTANEPMSHTTLQRAFARVRTFGWLHPAAKVRANRVRALQRVKPLLSPAEQQVWSPPPDPIEADPAPAAAAENKICSAPRCPRCQQPMRLVGTWRAGQMLPHRKRPP